MNTRQSIFLIILLCMTTHAQGRNVSVSVCDTMVLEYNYTYDSWGRPLTTTLAVNGGSAVTIENNTYDNYGRLASTSHGNAPKATTAYAYNIRDWITQISSTAFTEQLYYNTSHNGNTPQWGGNISAIAWQTAADSQSSKARGYNFTYDGVSRLTAANYFENNQSSGKYSTAYDYDAMSNITALHRNGLLDDGEYGTIDLLTYEYEGNQLIKVTDSNEEEPTYAHAMHFTDGADEEMEYEYNANGATTKDENKGIEVEYNALNLPQKITHRFGQYTTYLYSADGKRLRTEYYPTPAVLQPRIIGYDDWGFPIFGPPPAPTPSITRDYCGPFIYENNALKRILFNGGYITFNATSNQPEYHYYVKDHLGNIRAVINENDSIEEINHYYPYGALFGESTGLANSVQPYKYSGKELDRMHGMDMFDHGARWSDPLLGRWHKVDPLAEEYTWMSPYVLCANNPIKFVDPDGNKIVFINGKIGWGSPSKGLPYWNGANSNFVKGAINFFKDNHTLFIAEDYSYFSTARSRTKQGYKWAKENYDILIKGISENEPFYLVSHSMGGAFSKGVEKYLKEMGHNVGINLMINAYQVNQIHNDKNSETIYIDYQNTNDPVINWFGFSKGDLENADIQIREESKDGFLERHRSPIVNATDFWNTIRERINEAFNNE